MTPARTEEPTERPSPDPTPRPTPEPTTEPSAEPTRAPQDEPEVEGRNRFWFPSLGIKQSVQSFPCSRSREPDDYVYRWGCAGSGNVYLMAHAWGRFKALDRAYEAGRLRSGMIAAYADGDGDTHYYKLLWWKVHRPTPDTAWAWAAQSKSSLTLQTCVGEDSEYRLFVRFVEVEKP